MIKGQFSIACDRCGAKGEPKEIETPNNWARFSYRELLQPGWLATHGYALCPGCASNLSLIIRANRLVNEAIHKLGIGCTNNGESLSQFPDVSYHAVYKAMRAHCRIPTYPNLKDYVNEIRDARKRAADALAGSVPSSETKPSEPQAKEESSTIQILPPTYPYDTRPSDWIIPIEPQSVPIQESDANLEDTP